MPEETIKQKIAKEELELFKSLCREKFSDEKGKKILSLMVKSYLIEQPVYSASIQVNSDAWAHQREGQNSLIRFLMDSAGLSADVTIRNKID